MKPEIEKCVKYIRQFPLKEERTYYTTYWFPPESNPKEWIACLTSDKKEMLSARHVEVRCAGDEVYLVTAGAEAFDNFSRFKENVDSAMKEYAVAQKDRIELLRKLKEDKIKMAALEYVY
jgi:hypothetical protein